MRSAALLGAIAGLNIGLLAVGLVLVYRVGRFVNFAHAQLGVVSAVVLGKLVIDWGLSWWIAFPLAVLLGGAVGGLCEVLVIRRLARHSRIALLIATIGLSQVLLALTYFTWLGADRVQLNQQRYPLPFDFHARIWSLGIGTQQLLLLVLAPILVGAIAFVLHATLLGKSMRAVASNADAAALAGVPVKRVATVTWVIAGGLSAVSAILDAPGQAVFDTQALGPQLLLLALGAAAVGGFTSLSWAFAGGVGIGVVEGVALHLTRNGGTAKLWVLLVILATLIGRSRAIEASSRHVDGALGTDDRPLRVPIEVAGTFIARRWRAGVVVSGLLIGLVAPWLPMFASEGNRFLLSLTLVTAIVGMSLTLLTGWGGQVSLGQFAFVGVGAFVGARLVADGWSFGAGLVGAGLAGAALAVLVGLPALRLPGLTLAVTTLGFAVVGPSWLFRQEWFSPQGAVTVPAPELAGIGPIRTQVAVYYGALVVLALVGLALAALRRSSAGRLVLAVRDNERAAASFGVSATAVKVSVFAVSGFVAAAAGMVWLAAFRTVSVDLFDPQQSLLVLAVPVIGGVASVAGAVLGSALVFALPAFTEDWVKSVFTNSIQFQLFLGGFGLIATQIANPGGIAAVLRRQWERYLARMARERISTAATDAALAGIPLVVRDLSVSFGGIRALDGVSLEVRAGEVVGLIGTNGAGKTTLLNAVSGTVPLEDGSIRCYGRELAGLDPALRPHFGVGRSFQDARLFPALTVRETIQVALARFGRVGMLASLAGTPWSRAAERRTGARADELIAALGLTSWSDTVVSDLSTGTRRICDLAAQMAASPRLLLLDEPTAGIAQREAEAFGPLLRRVADDLDCAVLIIEHDMPLIRALADRIYCLDGGRVIAEGDPATISSDPKVIASYLGTDEAAIARSGARAAARPNGRGAHVSTNGTASRRAVPLRATRKRTPPDDGSATNRGVKTR